MKVSAKSRYALAVIIFMAKNPSQENITVQKISDSLGISKIFLEQVFSPMRHAGIVLSEKGAQGGYRLALPPEKITVYSILSSIETSLFSKIDPTVAQSASDIERAIAEVFFALDNVLVENLSSITLADMLNIAEQSREDGYMYYL